MERARSAVTNFFGRVPLAYTRFSLTPQTDGDASQVEMKLADDEECGDAMGEPVIKPREGNNGSRSLCLKILAVVLLFFIGFLIGYLSHRGRVSAAQQTTVDGTNEDKVVEEEVYEDHSQGNPSVLYWSDLKPMLDRRIELLNFETSMNNLYGLTRDAGSENEESLAALMDREFTKMGLDKVWSDEHYVTLQDKGGSNKVQIFTSDRLEADFELTSYVAYSPEGSVTGSLVYGHYGLPQDFDKLRFSNVNMTGVLVLLRSGKISFAEKVRNAEFAQAAGVLIYPDPSDFTFPFNANQDIESPFGHAHFGTGDPYTPGFPSFNHTQFPPSRSSGLPGIPVQTLSSMDGKNLLGKLDTKGCPIDWKVGCKLKTQYTVKLEVANVVAEKKILNVFGVIKGFEDPDRYVVVGAQRDSWSTGAAKAVVGSSVLLEVARVITQMVKEDQYKPRRSIVFASWSAGDFGAVGATEWLEGYLSTLHLKTISYISLDGAIQGAGPLQVSGSPLMYTMIQKTLKEVSDPTSNSDTKLSNGKEESKNVIQPLSIADAAYPFLAYSGVPSLSFSFIKDNKPYAYLGTRKDTFENFQKLVNVDRMCRAVANIATQVILRLTHDHKLPLDFVKYKEELLKISVYLKDKSADINGLGLTLDWINSASGDFGRAAITLKDTFASSDPENKPFLRSLNDRVMKVEHSLLSPYVSPKDSPFRHILYGYGNHTVEALKKHLSLLKNETLFDKDIFKNQFALYTWTVQGAANALAGEIWEIHNEF
ncbi:transferrin receptor protein 1 [Rana temporaria]|uniref:transferrin receptor protein 1 n=1 Tax=Rana temporaria TaxID=8407 RepID=UPI001AAD9832|nr:transferrin receptor protein 1 [Rana temporaria]XP_040205552.1 transferrin receptor protein 1 [Rana temporaria]XP_040205553.1 transferrin receptor protein 1 [Rana temporaria]